MLHALAAGVALVSSLAMSPSQISVTDNAPPPDSVTVSVVTANGSGCPDGSAVVAVSDDHTAFTVAYSNYLAQVGVGASPTDFRKNCQIGVKVNIPQGITFAIAEADYRGFGHLERGATGLESANYYFQGDPQSARITHNFGSGTDGDWQTKDMVGVAALVYQRCGTQRNLNINTELRVNAGHSDTHNTTSLLEMDSTDGSLTTVYHFSWKYCPAR
jgi:hypothetical protein